MPSLSSPARRASLRGAPAALCLLALTAMSALSGCGGGGGGGAAPDVASLPSSGAPVPGSAPGSAPGSPTDSRSGSGSGATPTGTAAGRSGRPQERLDDTPAEREALIHAWDECLAAHGARWTTGRAGVAGAPKQIADPVPVAASAACEDKLPLGPPELDPNLNPRYRDDMLAEISCLRAHGVMVHLTADTSVDPNGLGWTYDSGTTKVPDDEGQVEDQCQQAAFGNGKGK
jgi:hypothetical protein